MLYSRIDLHKTNYNVDLNWKFITNHNFSEIDRIYRSYCRYKRFESVMPLFESQFSNPRADTIGYYEKSTLVAFSLIIRHDTINAEAMQFAWTYENPLQRLGINSLKNECAIYKSMGYRYLYLGTADKYKEQFEGFEVLGPIE